MAEEISSNTYLKTRVYRVTKAYVLACGFALAWLNLSGPIFTWPLPALTIPEWISSATAALATSAVAALDALVGDRLKAILVFWRWTNPQPGSRAFERAYLDGDHRISIESLRAHLDGKLPRAARDQNSTWYRLYKQVQNEPEVAGTHYEYLLFRDLTWFSFILATLAFVSAAVNWERWRELLAYAGVACFLYALSRVRHSCAATGSSAQSSPSSRHGQSRRRLSRPSPQNRTPRDHQEHCTQHPHPDR
jgi:hypothetical protein